MMWFVRPTFREVVGMCFSMLRWKIRKRSKMIRELQPGDVIYHHIAGKREKVVLTQLVFTEGGDFELHGVTSDGEQFLQADFGCNNSVESFGYLSLP